MTPRPLDERAPRAWPLVQRVAFRFAFTYVLLYYPVMVVGRLPGFDWLVTGWNDAWALVVPWFARRVLRVAADFPDTSDGLLDVSYSYARLACVALSAAVVTVGWSLADRRRADHAKLDEWLRVLLRYGVANAMLFYGLAKVLKHQFTAPSLEVLLEPYGARSRMGILWAFMGSSTAYTAFCGAAECLGGVLLLFRRTTTLGALVVAAVMANVVMLDFSYGVFVKLYATHIFLMAVFLAAPDAGRLWRVLVLQSAVERRPLVPHFRASWARRAGGVAKALFVAYLVGSALVVQLDAWRSFGDAQPRPDLRGIWEVESFAVSDLEVPPLATDGTRWRRLVVDAAGGGSSSEATVWKMTDARERFRAGDDAAKRTLTLSDRKGAVVFAYTRPQPDELVLTRLAEGGAVRIALRRADEQSLPLVGERFHWVNDHPFGSR